MQDWKNITHVTVQSVYGGEISHYDTLEEAVRRTGWEAISRMNRGHLGYRPLDPSTFGSIAGLGGDKFAFYADGVYIPIWKVKEVADHLGMGYHTYRYRRNKFKFRDGPVEGIGGGYRWRRSQNVRTTQERRENDFLDRFDEDAHEHGIKARPSRSKMSLPNSWDDDGRRWFRQKSWKQYRSTQFKEVI